MGRSVPDTDFRYSSSDPDRIMPTISGANREFY